MLNVKINHLKPLEIIERDVLTISAHSLKGFTLVKCRGGTKAYRPLCSDLPPMEARLVVGSPAKPARELLSVIFLVLKFCLSKNNAVTYRNLNY